MSENLLFEVGTEEIPPKILPALGRNFRDVVGEILRDAGLTFSRIKCFYTPRRIAVKVSDLPCQQESWTETHRGPPEKVGIAEDGSYTVPAEKFAHSLDLTTEDLYVSETEEGSYLFADREFEGEASKELLSELLPETVSKLELPERMRWDDTYVEFVRPIRWIVAVLGECPLGFCVGNVESGNSTRGHRFYGKSEVELSDASRYEEILEDNFVVPDPEKRRKIMSDQLKGKAQQVGASHTADDEFLEFLANTLEYPTAISGGFPSEFLGLPNELLFNTLTKEARLIPVVDDAGEPMAEFIGFRDGPDEGLGPVQKGYESVIQARLRDSKFFFEHDREKSLEDHLPELENVIFQENLGTIWDKVTRMRKISQLISSHLGNINPNEVDRATLLSKADLVTAVVDEFPSLQGIIGAHYADLDGESEAVVRGIRQQYKPVRSEDSTPDSTVGAVVSISDKLDTLFGSFLNGERPTGSSDPYGLRRKADGIIRTLIDGEVCLDLRDLVFQTANLFEFGDQSKAQEELVGYFRERLDQVLIQNHDLSSDVIASLTLRACLDPYDVYLRAISIQKFKEEEEIKGLIDSLTRILNITGGCEEKSFDPTLIQESQERKLYRQFESTKNEVENLTRKKTYEKALQKLLKLEKPLDVYFENVMVMVEDEKIRENRLSLLKSISEMFLRIADFSEINYE